MTMSLLWNDIESPISTAPRRPWHAPAKMDALDLYRHEAEAKTEAEKIIDEWYGKQVSGVEDSIPVPFEEFEEEMKALLHAAVDDYFKPRKPVKSGRKVKV